MKTGNKRDVLLADRPWYTLEEACRLLGCTLKTGHNQIHMETFPVPHFKLGRRVAVMKEVVTLYFTLKSAEGVTELQKKTRRPVAEFRETCRK